MVSIGEIDNGGLVATSSLCKIGIAVQTLIQFSAKYFVATIDELPVLTTSSNNRPLQGIARPGAKNNL